MRTHALLRNFMEMLPVEGQHSPAQLLTGDVVFACHASPPGTKCLAHAKALATCCNALPSPSIIVWQELVSLPPGSTMMGWHAIKVRTLCYVDMLRPRAHRERKAYHALQDAFRETTGLPISTYFSAYKWLWLLENVEAVRQAVAEGRCMVGTMDSWLMYNLTGGVHGEHLLCPSGRSGMLCAWAGVNESPCTLPASCGIKLLPVWRKRPSREQGCVLYVCAIEGPSPASLGLRSVELLGMCSGCTIGFAAALARAHLQPLRMLCQLSPMLLPAQAASS